jgi:hypothetical protein
MPTCKDWVQEVGDGGDVMNHRCDRYKDDYVYEPQTDRKRLPEVITAQKTFSGELLHAVNHHLRVWRRISSLRKKQNFQDHLTGCKFFPEKIIRH